MTAPESGTRSTNHSALSRKIFKGLLGGVAVGLFAGTRTAVLAPLADAYIGLLQMTVLPYVTVSIIAGLAALNGDQGRTMGKRVGLVIVLLWMVALAIVAVFPLMFPPRESASFFSTSLTQEREPFNFLALYIPSNPFNSLANNVVPAVVLFSIILGSALISVPDKKPLLEMLGIIVKALSRVTNFIVELAPYGMFALGAFIAGTLSLEELRYMEVYLVSYIVMALLLSLWILPGLVAALTPVPYREILSRSRGALLMAFMTTSLFAVLPLLTENAKSLVRDYAGSKDDAEAVADVIVPTSFNFPHTGKILSLSFLLFIGWFMGEGVPVTEYPRLAGSGLLAMFGSANAAIPFLLDMLRLPSDAFRLFVTSGLVNARFGTLVAAVHTLVVAILGTCALVGAIRIDVRKLMRFGVVTVLVVTGTIAGTRVYLQASVDPTYQMSTMLTGRSLLSHRADARVFKQGEEVAPNPTGGSVLDRVRERGVLRIGYLDDSLPYAFFNSRGELVGFDVEMAYELARNLGVVPEFVPVSRSIFDKGLDPSVCDILMSGIVLTIDRAAHVQFSASYLDETVGFVVPDHMAAKFSDWSSVREMGRLRIGAPPAPYYVQRIRDELKDVEIVPFSRLDDVFVPHNPPLDAFAMTAERGSAYTLLHPEFSVAVPMPHPARVPLAYVIAGQDVAMTSMVNIWIEQKRKDGTIDRLFAYWILGQEDRPTHRRWSIMDDVLGW